MQSSHVAPWLISCYHTEWVNLFVLPIGNSPTKKRSVVLWLRDCPALSALSCPSAEIAKGTTKKNGGDGTIAFTVAMSCIGRILPRFGVYTCCHIWQFSCHTSRSLEYINESSGQKNIKVRLKGRIRSISVLGKCGETLGSAIQPLGSVSLRKDLWLWWSSPVCSRLAERRLEKAIEIWKEQSKWHDVIMQVLAWLRLHCYPKKIACWPYQPGFRVGSRTVRSLPIFVTPGPWFVKSGRLHLAGGDQWVNFAFPTVACQHAAVKRWKSLA